jgi:endonuclease/exonuclease/phosphatase family metal-dependent hydrolase
MSILAEIISRYDIVAIQEIRDKSGEAINALEAEVDALGTDYSYIIGPRLGRTSMKEQYAFMYRTDTIGLIGDYTYSDPYDIFHREPYMAWFTTRNGNFDFVLINAHLDPDNVSTEFPELYDASAEAWGLFEHELDIIALGDFNFDCNYQEESQKSPLPEHDYTWLIPDSADTNVARSDCTYDRIIIDYAMGSEDSTGNAGVFRFDYHYNLSYDQAKAVSDHYPVWAEFKINEDTR